MSTVWHWVRRHPIIAILSAVVAVAGVRNGDGIVGALFFVLILLGIAWIVDRRKGYRRDAPVRDRDGRFVAQGPPPPPVAPRRRATKSHLVADTTSPSALSQQRLLDQQTADLARREQQFHKEQDEANRRRAADLDAREAAIRKRETGPFPAPYPSPQQVTRLSPSQMAAKTDDEQAAPVGQSAFAETAHRPIPTAPPRPPSSLLSLNDLLTMSPTGFEEFCVRALQGIGYREVRRVGGAGDLTADIFAIDNEGRSTVVQCKRYKPGTKVGSPALQMFIGMKAVHHQADRGIYMTTADYSVPAVRLARQHDIVLIDGDDLVKIAGLVLMPKQTVPEVVAAIARYCGSCGAEFTDDAKFCASCGAARVA